MNKSDQIVVTDRRELMATFERGAADAGARTVPVVLTTTTPVIGRTGMAEILRHSTEAIDLSHAQRGLPLQISHNGHELPVGRVENIRLDGEKTRGLARFGQSARAEEVYRDVMDDIITDVSIGASVSEWSDPQPDGTIYAERWRPLELSLVSIGGDPAAGTFRNNQGSAMNSPNLAAKDKAADDVTRAQEIGALFADLNGERWLTMERDALREGKTVEVVRAEVFAALKADAAQTVQVSPDTVIRGGRDGVETWVADADAALTVNFGLVPDAERAQAVKGLERNPLAGMTLRELAREYLRVRGAPISGNVNRMVDHALSLPALVNRNFSHSTSDFANLLGGSAEKALQIGYTEAPETYQAWTRNVTMNNFRAHTFTNMSSASDLEEIAEDGEYTYGTFSDRANSATLATYGKGFAITRQAIINDDLNAFVDIPRKMGRASGRKVGDLAYAILTGNVKLSEQAGATLFNTTDGNLAAAAATISTTSMGLVRKALRTRTDPGGATLNITPRTLLVPAALETHAQVFLRTATKPGGSDNDVNVFANSMDLVVEPRLDANSATAWYVMTQAGGEVETVVLGWLDGRQEPYLESENGFDIDGMKYKVRIDCTAAALDWRGMQKNAGA